MIMLLIMILVLTDSTPLVFWLQESNFVINNGVPVMLKHACNANCSSGGGGWMRVGNNLHSVSDCPLCASARRLGVRSTGEGRERQWSLRACPGVLLTIVLTPTIHSSAPQALPVRTVILYFSLPIITNKHIGY